MTKKNQKRSFVAPTIERLEKLQNEERFDPESDSPFGLPKVRTKFRVKKKKKETQQSPVKNLTTIASIFSNNIM